MLCLASIFFFFNDTATTEIYTLSLHDALPISLRTRGTDRRRDPRPGAGAGRDHGGHQDRKSTRLKSSHSQISYAVFCLKKKKTTIGTGSRSLPCLCVAPSDPTLVARATARSSS